MSAYETVFSIFTVFCILYDIVLFISVVQVRFWRKKSQPFVYIAYMSVDGLVGKTCYLLMINAMQVGNWIAPPDGYERFRAAYGKQYTLLGTMHYLLMLCWNFLMTMNRVWVLMYPLETKMFSEFRLVIYCGGIMIGVFISMIIPYYSTCYIVFEVVVGFASACAPGRHPITLFQNYYAIYLPIVSMIINFAIILRMKFRRVKTTQQVLSATQSSRENSMLRQAAFIATYMAFYETSSLLIRWYPDIYQSFPEAFRTIYFYFRFVAVTSLSFCVYFLTTRSTRQLVLKFLGIQWGTRKRNTVIVTASQSNNAN